MTAATAEPATVHERIAGHEQAVIGSYRRSAPAPARLGPLLSVCGLAGGVGVTTLAYLIALAAARQWPDPVLVADTGGPSGGLAACAGVEVPRSLGELAEQLAAGAPLGAGIYGVGQDGVRVLAAGPEFASRCRDDEVNELVADAREAHGLTVIDCGTLAREADQIVAADATHIAWMLSATGNGVERGRRVLEAAPRTVAQGADRRAQRHPPDPGAAAATEAARRRAASPPRPGAPPHRPGERRDRSVRRRSPGARPGDPRSAQAMTGHRTEPRSATVPAAAQCARPAHVALEQRGGSRRSSGRRRCSKRSGSQARSPPR